MRVLQSLAWTPRASLTFWECMLFKGYFGPPAPPIGAVVVLAATALIELLLPLPPPAPPPGKLETVRRGCHDGVTHINFVAVPTQPRAACMSPVQAARGAWAGQVHLQPGGACQGRRGRHMSRLLRLRTRSQHSCPRHL